MRPQVCSPSYQPFPSFLLVTQTQRGNFKNGCKTTKSLYLLHLQPYLVSTCLFPKQCLDIASRITSCDRVVQSEGTVLSRALRSGRDRQGESCSRRSLWFVPFLSPCVDPTQNQGAARRTLVDVEKLQTEAVAERQITHDRLRAAELRLRELEAKLEEEGRETSETTVLRQRLAEELEDEREQHQKDLSERDFTIDQTRKKYQGMFCGHWDYAITDEAPAELAQLSEGKVTCNLVS